MSLLSRVYPFNQRPERSLSLSLSFSFVVESLLCSSKRGRRWPWTNKSNGPAGQNRFPFRKLKLAVVQIAHKNNSHASRLYHRRSRFSIFFIHGKNRGRDNLLFFCSMKTKFEVSLALFEARIKDDIKM